MKIGDLVMTNTIEARTDPGPKPAMRAKFKANPGHAFVFLNFGTVKDLAEVDDRVKQVMAHLGWVACNDAEGLRGALAALEKESSDADPQTQRR